MTCREKLMMEHPNNLSPAWGGGCYGCPVDYDYLTKPSYCLGKPDNVLCTKCWDREIPGTEKAKPETPWDQIKGLINNAMEKRDRSVSLYFNPNTGMSVSVYPWPDAEELWDQYQNGKVTANDFRVKMGLPRATTSGEKEISYVTFKDGHTERIVHFRVRNQHTLFVTENAVYILVKGDDCATDAIYVLLFSALNDEGFPTLQFKTVNDIKSIRLANPDFAESK